MSNKKTQDQIFELEQNILRLTNEVQELRDLLESSEEAIGAALMYGEEASDGNHEDATELHRKVEEWVAKRDAALGAP